MQPTKIHKIPIHVLFAPLKNTNNPVFVLLPLFFSLKSTDKVLKTAPTEFSARAVPYSFMCLTGLPDEVEDYVARDACSVHFLDVGCEGLADACILCRILLSELEVSGCLSLEDEACP